MANTSAQHLAEAWVIETVLPSHFPGIAFAGRKLKLKWGGFFAFDAVSQDGTIVVAISTSSARTAKGKAATAKFQKLKTDSLYLLHVESARRRLMVFTEQSMLEYFKKEVSSGRFPPEIELVHIELPIEILAKVLAARDIASKETSPTGRTKNAL